MPSVETLNQLFHADFVNGMLYWKRRDVSAFKTEKAANTWNTRFAGKEALKGKDKTGRKRGTIFCVHASAHRVLWKMAYGTEPELIDHINGDPSDNRIENLRCATPAQNSANSSRSIANRSGCCGVSWSKQKRKWWVKIRREFIGLYDDLDEAVRARKEAERHRGFHPNHGRDRQEA